MTGNKRRALLIVLLSVVLLVSLFMVGSRLWDYRRGEEDYREAEELAGLPDLSGLPTPTPAVQSSAAPTPTPDPTASAAPDTTPEPTAEPTPTPYVDPYADALREMDFAALRRANSQVLGWIVIPGTSLSYPYVQGEDNSYYLDHTWRRSRNSVGAIFMECKSDPALGDFNTMIYGHHMHNDSMFHSLLSYTTREYWEKHPSVYITDDAGSHRYDIFAACEVEVTDPVYYLNVTGKALKQRVIDFALEHSVIDTGVVPTTEDSLVTLSTCVSTAASPTRWVVLGVRWAEPAGEEPSPTPTEEPAPTAEPTPSETLSDRDRQ